MLDGARGGPRQLLIIRGLGQVVEGAQAEGLDGETTEKTWYCVSGCSEYRHRTYGWDFSTRISCVDPDVVPDRSTVSPLATAIPCFGSAVSMSQRERCKVLSSGGGAGVAGRLTSEWRPEVSAPGSS